MTGKQGGHIGLPKNKQYRRKQGGHTGPPLPGMTKRILNSLRDYVAA